jgi:signal transduction histidine kinase
MSRLPIRLRVTAAFAVAMAAVFAGTGWVLYAQLGSHLALALDRDLQLRAQDLVVLVNRGSRELPQVSGSKFVERGESFAQLVDRSGRVVDATVPLGKSRLLTPAELRAARAHPIYADRSQVIGLNEPARLLATPVKRGVLVVGATLQNRAETLSSFRYELFVAGPVALLIASLVGYLLAGLSLRQVESMRRRATSISAETPGARLPVPETGDELQRLAETLNEMLGRLEDALELERRFVADAGHELRTPLALLRTELELALRQASSPEDLRSSVERAVREADRLSLLAEDLLLIAQSDRGTLPLRLEAVDVDGLFGSLLNRFGPGNSLSSAAAPDLVVHGDRLRLEQALANLVDNALRHGGGAIELSAAASDGVVELHVRDEGQGFPSEFLDRAFERFTRADPARSTGGAGLGLSIVSVIAAAHGGSAHAANTSPHGADVWIELPREPAASDARSPERRTGAAHPARRPGSSRAAPAAHDR